MSTHQQLLYHIVFSTKGRRALLQNEKFREEVFAYLAATAKNLGGFPIIVGGFIDHVHLLVRIPAKGSVSHFVGQAKANTSKNFSGVYWQDGFGAFTVSPSVKESVYNYIANQSRHHAKKSFEDEYLLLLEKHEVEFDRKYVFD